MRVNVYVSDRISPEIKALAEKYKVSASYVLQTGYKLCDRRSLENVLSINLLDDSLEK